MSVSPCSKTSAGLELTYWSNWVLLAFVMLVAAFLRSARDGALAPGGWASALVYRKAGTYTPPLLDST